VLPRTKPQTNADRIRIEKGFFRRVAIRSDCAGIDVMVILLSSFVVFSGVAGDLLAGPWLGALLMQAIFICLDTIDA